MHTKILQIQKRIIFSLIKTKTFVKYNPQIIFTQADKVNVVVAIDKTQYIQKMKLIFADSDV